MILTRWLGKLLSADKWLWLSMSNRCLGSSQRGEIWAWFQWLGVFYPKKKKKTGGCTRCSSSCNNLNKWRLTHPFSFECAWEGKALLETSYLELNSSEFIVKRVLIVEGIQVRVLEGTITFLNFNLLGSWWVFISYQRENIWWPRVNMNL